MSPVTRTQKRFVPRSRPCETTGGGEVPAAGWGWTAWTTSSLSSSRGHGKHQWSLQINSGGPFQSWANSVFINLAKLTHEKPKSERTWTTDALTRMKCFFGFRVGFIGQTQGTSLQFWVALNVVLHIFKNNYQGVRKRQQKKQQIRVSMCTNNNLDHYWYWMMPLHSRSLIIACRMSPPSLTLSSSSQVAEAASLTPSASWLMFASSAR